MSRIKRSPNASERTGAREPPSGAPLREHGPRAFGGAIRFRILGPLEVDPGSGPMPLGGRKQRSVLAVLIARANESVPTEWLIDEIWGQDPPDTARNVIQTYISHLRKALGHDRIAGDSPGYRLRLDRSELDAARFDALVRDAKKTMPVDPALAVGILEDALALWRGPALGDLEDSPSLLAEGGRLDDLRLEAQEERIEGLMASGANARTIGELEALIALHPWRESLWGLLVLSLYREGRQAEALNAFQRAREILADELGIDPSPELARLHERVLRQDAALELRGEPLRGYRLLEQIGEGTRGTVFRAIQPHVGRDVAVKIIHGEIASNAAFVRSFEPRAQAAAALEHPHIAPVYDYWREPGRAYIASRYLRGGSLRALDERGEVLEPGRAARVLEQIASGLAFAHRLSVAHGHVCPANVLFDEEGNAYLGDFASGTGPDPDPGHDIRELAELSVFLLPNVPLVSELARRAELEGDALAAADFIEVARSALGRAPEPILERREKRNPYKGLRAFTEADAHDFFGRGALITRLVSRMDGSGPGSRFLAVVGPSGGGKSSVVKAGVVPALRRGALTDIGVLYVTEMFPGAHPIDELESALLRISVGPVPRLTERLESGSRGLLEAIDLVVPGDGEVVLVVDQFEEVFTLTTTEAERELFLESLRVAIADPSSRLRVIVTLRADFYDRPLIYPRLGELIADRSEAVPPLTPDELEQVIRMPAEQVGMSIGPGLVAEMIGDVVHQPGGLPLLQYALTELYERREGDELTLSAYRDMGGVAGALSARAERILGTTDQTGRRATKQVFLRLVTLGEGRQDTRRRVARRELDSLEGERDTIDAVVDSYGRHRLLTFDREPSTREPTVEIAHEALLTAWTRLRGWIDWARDDLRQNGRLTQAAAEWRGAGRDPSFLLSGARLEQVDAWVSTTDLALGRPEREYIKESLDERDRAVARERARQERETQLERRSARRLRGLVAVLAVGALVASTLSLIATNQRDMAGQEAARAERAALMASVRELVAASVADLDTDAERSILLAIEAVELTRAVDGSVLPEAEDALHRAIAASRIVMTVPGIGGALSWSPKGVFVAQSSRDPEMIEIRDDSTGETILSFRGHDGDVTDAVFSPDGSMLATTGTDGLLKIWDPSSGALVTRVRGTGPAGGVSFSADGSRVAADWWKEPVVRVAIPVTGEVVRKLPSADPALSPDASRIALAGDDLVVTDLPSRERTVVDRADFWIEKPSWSPDGNYLAADNGSWIDLFDTRSGDRVDRLSGVQGEAAWSPDSSRLVTSGFEPGTAIVWSIQEDGTASETLTLRAGDMRSKIKGLTFSPDGAAIMAGDERMTAVKVWELEPRGFEVASIRVYHYWWPDVEFLPDGRGVAANTDGWASLRIWDVASGRLVSEFENDPYTDAHKEGSFDVSPDGGLVVLIPGMRVWDLATHEEVVTMRRDGVNSAGWSPDGQLLVTAGTDGSVRVIDRSGREIRHFDAGWKEVKDARFSPDGGMVAATNDDESETVVWDWERAEVVARIPDGAYEIAFDPSGSRIVSSHGRIWDLKSGQQIGALSDEREGVRYVYSPDGSRIARTSIDGGVALFDARTGEELFSLRDDCAVSGVDFDTDGSQIATVDGCFRVMVWAHSIDELLDLGRRLVTRGLTDVECRKYLHVERCRV